MSHLNTSVRTVPERAAFSQRVSTLLLRTLLLPALMLMAPLAWGQIFSNPITGTNPNTSNPYTNGQVVDGNLTVSGIGRGIGITGTNANDRYNASGWNVGGLNATKYFEFTLTPNANHTISFVNFEYTGQASGTGPTSFALRSSTDGYTTDIGAPLVSGASINLSGPAFQDLSAAITFRLYAWGASAAGGTFSVNSFEFNGSVDPCPTASIAYSGTPYCGNGGTANVALTGSTGGTYTSAGGLSIDGSTGAVDLGASSPGTYTVTYTIAASGGCAEYTTTTSITITEVPSATIAYGASSYCTNDADPTPSTTGTSGGTFSGTAGLVINAASGEIDLSASTAGPHTATYTIAAAGGCALYTTTFNLTVVAGPFATISYNFSPYCSTAGIATVTRTGTSGGTYSASPAGLSINATIGAVTLASSTPGTYTVSYTLAPSGGCSGFVATTSITVTQSPDFTFSYAGDPYCSNEGTATVTSAGVPVTGTYSSDPGLSLTGSTGAVNLGTSTPGSYTVVYNVPPAGGCGPYATTADITVIATTAWYQDVDNDGFGDPSNSVMACVQPVGYVDNNTDSCPSDPAKTSAGNCGCLVAETSCTEGCADPLAVNYNANINLRYADCLYCEEGQHFDGPVTTAIAQAADTWYRDRYQPFAFNGGVSFAGRAALQHSIDASDCESCRPGGFTGSFYNTQGRKYDLPAETKEMSVDLYIPADWASTGRRMAGLWATAVDVSNVVSAYPILEFTSDAGTPRFRAFNNGVWVDMGLPTVFTYNSWVTLTIRLLPSGEFHYQAGDKVAQTTTLGNASVRMSDVILQGHNTATPGVTYDIHWDDLSYFQEDSDTDGDGVGDACDFCPTLANYTMNGPVQNTTQNTFYCTIQAALDVADPNDVITVAAGTYAENLGIYQAVDLRGPNYGVAGNSNLRAAEAIIHPATTGAFVYNVDVDADDVRIDGFLFDGDNPELTSGFTNTTLADIDGASAIDAYFGGTDRLVVQNNIIRNYFYQAVTIYPYEDSGNGGAGTPSSGHIIAENLFEDLGTYDITYPYYGWGGAVLLYNNAYAKVESNVMSNVRGGVQTGNYSQSTPDVGFDHGIRDNTISARRRGIFLNLHYGPSTPFTLENNTITGVVNANESVWDGILLSSLSIPSFTINNTIDGSAISNPREGIEVWNVKNTTPASISGGTITGVSTGIFLNNYEGYAENAADGAHATISGVSIDADVVGIRVLDSPSSTTHANVQATVTNNFIVGGIDGVKLEEALAGKVTGTVTNNSITGYSSKAINATTSTNTVAASCNWYGSNLPLTVQAATTGNVSFLQYLTSGIDADNNALTGFQPESGACGGNGPVRVYTDGTLSTLVSSHYTIQSAIDAGTTLNGHVVTVDAGIYAENVTIAKGLDIRGPKYGLAGSNGSRGTGEAIVVPGVSNAGGEIFMVQTSNVSINGFTFDGDNTALTSGWVGTNGADINAAEAVTVYVAGVNNLSVTHNIIQNVGYFGVTLYGAATSDANTSKTGHLIADNLFRDLGHYNTTNGFDNWGGGILLYNSHYTRVVDNVMTNVRIGIQTGNYQTTHAGDPQFQVIDNNSIQTRYLGVFYNLHRYSPWTISNNTITGLDNAVEAGLATRPWRGMLLGSLGNNMGASTFSDNTIDGSGITLFTSGKEGVNVWNVQNTAAVNFAGGSISGVESGFFLNNFEGYATNATDGAHATISSVSIDADVVGIRVLDSPSSTTHANVQATLTNNFIVGGIDGVKLEEALAGKVTGTVTNNSITGYSSKAINATTSTNTVAASCNWYGSNLPLTVQAATAGNVSFLPYLTSGIDADNNALNGFQPESGACGGNGPVRVYTDGTLSTLVSSHYTIQSAIDAGTTLNGHVVTVDAGTYAENVNVNKGVTILGNGGAPATRPVVTATTGTEVILVSVPSVTIENLEVRFNQGPVVSAIRTTASGSYTGLEVADCLISGTGTTGATVFGSFGIQLGSFGGVVFDEVTLTNNTIGHTGTSPLGRAVRSLNVHGNWSGNTLSAWYSMQVGDVAGGLLVVQNNTLTGVAEINNLAFAGNHRFEDNDLFPSNAYGAGSDFAQVELKNISFTGANLSIKDNTFNDYTNYGIFSGRANNVTVEGNTFNPLATAAAYRSVRLDTKQRTTASQPAFTVGMALVNNVFIGNGLAGGIALEVANSDNVSSIGSVTLSGNSFAASNGGYISLNHETGSTVGDAIWTGMYASTKDPVTTNIDATNNTFDGTAANVMTLAQHFSAEDKIQHGIDQVVLGLVRVKAGEVFVTPNSFVAPATMTPSIQRGVNEATAGDIVNVQAGTYAENLNADKALTLLGANAGVACGSRGPESLIAPATGLPVNVSADGVTLNGFEITAPSYQYAVVGGGRSNLDIAFNNIHDINSSGTPVLTTTHAIQYTVGNSPTAAINVNVSDNCIDNVGSTNLTNGVLGYSAAAIGFLQSTTTGTLTGITIERNRITDVVVSSLPWPAGKIANGIQLNVGGSGSYLTTTGNIMDAGIRDNEISNISGHIATGIGLEGNTQNAVVTGNAVSNLSGTKTAVRAGGGYDLNALKFENNRYVATVTVEDNSFATNTFTHSAGPSIKGYGVVNYVPVGLTSLDGTTGSADVSCNWFGTAVASEIADNGSLTGRLMDKVGAATNATPFRTSGLDASLTTIGFQPTGACDGEGPVLNEDTDISYFTIQSAIDAPLTVNGHTIQVAAGSYAENVVANKAVTLLGANAGSPRCTASGESTIAGGPTGTAVTIASNDVTIDGFELTGMIGVSSTGFSGADITNNLVSTSFYGIAAAGINNGFDITDNCVAMTGQVLSGQPSAGIALNGASGATPLNVVDNTVSNGFYGYVLHAITTAPATAVSGGTITGVMQGVVVVNTLDGVNYFPSTAVVENILMDDFAGAHPALPGANFRSGVYAFTGGANAGAVVDLTVNDVDVSGTGNHAGNSSGLHFADFSTVGSTLLNATVTNSNIHDNLNRGIFVRGLNCEVDVTASTIANNGGAQTPGNTGTGVFVSNGALATVSECFISNPATSLNPVYALSARNVGAPQVSGSLVAYDNSFSNNGNTLNGRATLNDGTAADLVATCNWWGSVIEGTFTPLFVGPLSYQPWLVDGTDNDAVAAGFQPVPGSCVGPVVLVDAKALLEGPYDNVTDLMNDDLRELALFPTEQPYDNMPVLWPPYLGDETIDPAVLSVSGDFAVVDWVLVELRDDATPTVVSARRAGLMLRNGNIVDVDGVSPLRFPLTPDGTYKVVVRHRNHLGAMTLNGFALSAANSTVVDFNSVATWGTAAQKFLDGRWMLWSGNVNRDKRLSYAGSGNDRDPILAYLFAQPGPPPTPTSVVPDVYRDEDVNLDGSVKYAGSRNDRDPILVNIGSVPATAIRNEQLP